MRVGAIILGGWLSIKIYCVSEKPFFTKSRKHMRLLIIEASVVTKTGDDLVTTYNPLLSFPTPPPHLHQPTNDMLLPADSLPSSFLGLPQAFFVVCRLSGSTLTWIFLSISCFRIIISDANLFSYIYYIKQAQMSYCWPFLIITKKILTSIVYFNYSKPDTQSHK